MAPLIFFCCLFAGLVIALYMIAADRQRFLARFELSAWKETDYLRSLPNFLQALHDNHFASSWPRRPNAVSAHLFMFRANAFLRKKPAALRRSFLEQHIILFGLLNVLSPFIKDFIYNEQRHIIADRIVGMEDTIERDRLISFLDSLKSHRENFYRSLTAMDRQIMAQIIERRLIPTLRSAHSIFQEHGFTLLPDFTQLRRWEEMTGSELVQELPVLPVWKRGRERRQLA